MSRLNETHMASFAKMKNLHQVDDAGTLIHLGFTFEVKSWIVNANSIHLKWKAGKEGLEGPPSLSSWTKLVSQIGRQLVPHAAGLFV